MFGPPEFFLLAILGLVIVSTTSRGKLLRGLITGAFGLMVAFLDLIPVIGSTMQMASELAAKGCPSGTVVGADEQTAGRGRYGRVWHSEPGSGLYVSEVLRLRLPPADLPAVTLTLGLAVAEAILNTTGIPCDLRWPNDVMVAGKKCAGILVQLQDDAVIAGIGVNVNQTVFPEELQPLATSLRIVSGREQSRDALFENLPRQAAKPAYQLQILAPC